MPASTPWIAVTLDDVRACVLAEKIDLVLSRAAASNQADPFASNQRKVVARVHSKVAANAKNRLSADPTLVPPELADVTALLIAYGMVLPLTEIKAGQLGDSQQKAIEQAEQDLKDVAAAKYAVSLPPDAEAPGTGVAPTTGTIAVVGGNPRLSTRDQLRGL